MPTPEEQAEFLKIWREQKAAESGKQNAGENAEKEAQAKAKKREINALRLKALAVQKEELEIRKRELRDEMEAEERQIDPDRQKKRGRRGDDEYTESKAYSRQSRSRVVISTDSEDEDE